ncbi:MAG: nucleotidyltransferase domain-containing protein [Chlorobi bacterium]|nr:nucleotidyltransferase domain-containing protein [Chlorobiota bacterium]
MQPFIKNKISELKNICSRLGVRRLYIFGSASSTDFDEGSDIDFLISFSDALSVEQYTSNYFELHYKLRELFKREIDVITERSLSNPYFIESVNKTKKLIYEARH